MNRYFKRVCSGVLSLAMVMTVCGCGKSTKSKTDDTLTNALDPENPTTITIWNYYNGDQLNAFNKLVEEFNSTVGADDGVVVVSLSQGDINTLADSLIDSAEGKAGAEELPTLASVYAETAYILDQSNMLESFDPYFTDNELSEYVSSFIDEGRFNENNDLLLFPISKSTEVFTANATDWQTFTDETGIALADIKTQEDLVSAAKTYYEWTDGLTPDVAEDGKALYGRDSVANYIYRGSYQLGHEIFPVKDGKMTLDLDRDTFKILWDNYYIPYINGYFGSYANFRSEDAKTGKILALTSSTSSMGYLPDQVTLEDDSVHDIVMTATDSLSFENATTDAVVQQGASFCMLHSTDAEQQGAVEFVKWFTETDRNMDFSLMSGYSSVKKESNTEEAITKAYSGDTSTSLGKNVLDSLKLSADAFSNKTPYATKPFKGSKDVRTLLDSSLTDISVQDREKVVANLKSGMTHEEAVAEFTTDEYFDAWFEQLTADVKGLVE